MFVQKLVTSATEVTWNWLLRTADKVISDIFKCVKITEKQINHNQIDIFPSDKILLSLSISDKTGHGHDTANVRL